MTTNLGNLGNFWFSTGLVPVGTEFEYYSRALHTPDSPEDYAQHLLSVVRSVRQTRIPTAMAMAKHGRLDVRIRKIIDYMSTARSGRPLSMLTITVLPLLLGLVSAVRLVPAESPASNVPASNIQASESASTLSPVSKVDESKGEQEEATDEPENKAKTKQILKEHFRLKHGEHIYSGRIVDSQGAPIANADVAAVGDDLNRYGGFEDSGELLGETHSDEQGNFRLTLDGFSSKTHRDAKLIARKENFSISWQRLNLDQDESNISLELPPEQIVKGRLVDNEGNPAATVEMDVRSVKSAKEDPFGNGGLRFHTDQDIAAWVGPIQTDHDGRFSIHNIPAGLGVFLKVAAADRFAPQFIALNSGHSETRGERDGTYRGIVKNIPPGEEGIVVLSSAKVFRGTITCEHTGEPVPGAIVEVTASEEEGGLGSMVALKTKADEYGKYAIAPYPGVEFGVMAIPPKGSSYLTRKLEATLWKDAETERIQDVKLPRGVLVQGSVQVKGTSIPVAGANLAVSARKRKQ